MDFYKGFVKTKNKKCVEKFKGRTDFSSYEDIKDADEFAGILADDAILVDLDDGNQSEVLMNIVEALQLNCKVYQTTRGKHFLFKNHSVQKCYTHATLACGLTADIKVGTKSSYEVIKFGGKERFVEWDRDETQPYDEIPKWLFPVKGNTDFLSMDAGDGRNQALFNYILTLQSADFTQEEARETIRIINRYVIKDPLDESELETILRDDAFQLPIFFKGTSFKHDVFAVFMKNYHHIIRINGQLHLYKNGIYVSGYSNLESEMIRHIPSLNQAKRKEVLTYLEILIRDETPVADASMIAFRNGIYNLKTGEFLNFHPSIVVTNIIPWDWNPQADDELTDKILGNISCHDPATRLLMEEMIGYCMFSRNELGKAFILTGSGSNGKSTFLNMVKDLLGEKNYSVLDLKKIDDRFSTVMLYGKLANIGDDISDDFVTDAAEFKKVVTGETIDAEQKGQPKFNFKPYCKLIFSANNIPRIGRGRDTSAVLRRLIIVPFNATFTKDSPEYLPFISDNLKRQEVMEYLIQIGVKALKGVLERKTFTTSDEMEQELKEYEETNNPVLRFFREVVEGEDFNLDGETNQTVYRRYSEWCLSNSLQAMSNIEFSKQVKKYYGLQIVDRKVGGKKFRIYIK